MNLVLFDFDGTITRDDSLLEFVAYVVGFKKFFRGILVLSPILAAYKLGLASNNFTRRKLLGYFFAGMSADKFDKILHILKGTDIIPYRCTGTRKMF